MQVNGLTKPTGEMKVIYLTMWFLMENYLLTLS